MTTLQGPRSGLCECTTYTLKPGQCCSLLTRPPWPGTRSNIARIHHTSRYHLLLQRFVTYDILLILAGLLRYWEVNTTSKEKTPQKILQSRTSENHFPRVNPPSLIRNPPAKPTTRPTYPTNRVSESVPLSILVGRNLITSPPLGFIDVGTSYLPHKVQTNQLNPCS